MSNSLKTAGHLYKKQLENWLSKPPNFNDTAKKKACDIFFVTSFWWELVDSNHRSIKQQIYSLSPLATRESSLVQLSAPAPECLIIIANQKEKCKPFFEFFLIFFEKIKTDLKITMISEKAVEGRAEGAGCKRRKAFSGLYFCITVEKRFYV